MIKRGVSLYSYQEEFFLRKMTLEDCIATSASFGACGIELLGEQMVPGFPTLPSAFLDKWYGWMAQYGTTPVCHDMFLDTKRFKNRLLTENEMMESVVRDLKFASQLGCTVMRCIVITPPEIMAKCAPYAEKYNVKMGIEIHAPWNFDHEWIQQHLEVMEKVGSPFLGFIPDFGIFEKRYQRVIRDRFLRDGVQESIANHIVEVFDSHADMNTLIEDVMKMGGKDADLAMAYDATRRIWTDPRRMLEHMPRIFHVHAKFNEMLDDCTEYGIPYDEIIPVLVEGGYDGYLASEYEGNRHIQDVFEVDSVEQVRRHQELLKRMLGETQPEPAVVQN